MRKLDTHWKSTISDLFLSDEYYFKKDIINTLWEKDCIMIEAFLWQKEKFVLNNLKTDIDKKSCVRINLNDLPNFTWFVDWFIWNESHLKVLEYLLRKNIYKTNQIVSPLWDWQILQFQLEWELYYYINWRESFIMNQIHFQKYIKENKLLIFTFDQWVEELKKSYSLLMMKGVNKTIFLQSMTVFMGKHWLLVKEIVDNKWDIDFNKLTDYINYRMFLLNDVDSIFNLKVVIELLLVFMYFYDINIDFENTDNDYWVNKDSVQLLGFMQDTEFDYKNLYEKKKNHIVLSIASIINVTWNISLYNLIKELSQVLIADNFEMFSFSTFSQYCIRQLFFYSNDYECSQYICTNWAIWIKSIEIDKNKYYYHIKDNEILFFSNDWFLDYCAINKHFLIKNPNSIASEFKHILNLIEKKWINTGVLLSEIKVLIRAIYAGMPNVFMDKNFNEITELLSTIEYVDSNLQYLLESIFQHMNNRLNKSFNNNIQSKNNLEDIIDKQVWIIINKQWSVKKSFLVESVLEYLNNDYSDVKDYFVDKYFNENKKELKQLYNLDPHSDLIIYWFTINNQEYVLLKSVDEDIYMSAKEFIDYENKNLLLLCEDIHKYQEYLVSYLNNCINSWISWWEIVMALIENQLLPKEMIIPWMSRIQFIKNVNAIFPQTNFIKLLIDIKHTTPHFASPFQYRKILLVLENLENKRSNHWKSN